MPDFVYVALQGDDKIARFTLDSATGDLEPEGAVAVPGGPAPMVVDPAEQVLHVAQRGACTLSSYRIDQRTGDLSLIGTVSLPTDPATSPPIPSARGRCGSRSWTSGAALDAEPSPT